MIESKSARSIALLIDGDNAQPNMIGKIIKEISQYGIVTIRRIYGDWTQANMQSWKNVLQLHAIQPMQQFRIVAGKNSTDNAMIIDAMDILYEKNISGFCIVSSDSDFTRLATRIREDKLFVIGVGREGTPKPFKKACSHFISTEILEKSAQSVIVIPPPVEKLPAPSKPSKKLPTTSTPNNSPETPSKQEQVTALLKLFKQAFSECPQDDGWVGLGQFGSKLRGCDAEFKSNKYGSNTLLKLVKTYPKWFDVKGTGSDTRIRLKKI